MTHAATWDYMQIPKKKLHCCLFEKVCLRMLLPRKVFYCRHFYKLRESKAPLSRISTSSVIVMYRVKVMNLPYAHQFIVGK